jgi:hypothetical protein
MTAPDNNPIRAQLIADGLIVPEEQQTIVPVIGSDKNVLRLDEATRSKLAKHFRGSGERRGRPEKAA